MQSSDLAFFDIQIPEEVCLQRQLMLQLAASVLRGARDVLRQMKLHFARL